MTAEGIDVGCRQACTCWRLVKLSRKNASIMFCYREMLSRRCESCSPLWVHSRSCSARKFSIFWSSPFRSPAISKAKNIKYPSVRISELKRVHRRWRGGKRADSIHLHPTHNGYQFHEWDMEISARSAASTEVFTSANNRVAENRDISHQLKPQKKSTTVRQIIHNVSWHELDGKCTVDKKPHRDSHRKR